MLNMRNAIWIFLFLFVFVVMPFSIQAQTPQQTLNQYIADLQNNPDDNALREKIIKHVQTMKPKPAIPEDARRHYVKACALFEDAKQPADSADAAEEFRQALLIASWRGEAYMKMGLALETAQRYDDAIAALKLFMTTNPKGELQRKTQDEIYKIEAKAQKATKAVEDQRAQQEAFLKKINGARYIVTLTMERARTSMGYVAIWFGSTYWMFRAIQPRN